MEFCARWRHLQRVRFILAQFLNWLAGVVCGNNQRGLCGVRGGSGLRKDESRLSVELQQESLCRTLQARFAVSGKCQRKASIDLQRAAGELRFGGQWHHVQFRWRLRSCFHTSCYR